MAITKIGTPELFDFSATNTALQLPTGDTASRPTSPSTGEWRYNTTDNRVEYYDGAAWFQIEDEAIPSPVPVGSEHFNVNTYFGNGATQTIDAKFNEAANFNGSSSQIELPFNPIGTNLIGSISLWLQGASFGNSAASTDIAFYNRNPYVLIDTYQNNLRVIVKNSSSSNTTISYALSNFNTSDWYNIAVVLTGVSSTFTLYVNGSSVGTATAPSSTLNVASTALIGLNSATWNGKIDQVRLFNTALPATGTASVATLYNDETTTTAATLDFPAGAGCIAGYQLDGNGDDISGNYSATSTTDIGYTGLKFQPDLIWLKGRNNGNIHILTDSIRGTNSQLSSNNTGAETTYSSNITAFNSNGFTLGSATDTNGVNNTYVSWNWRAAGFANAFNVLEVGTITTSSSASTAGITAGSITTGWNVSANRDAGFSIVKYTGTGGTGTVGTGLSSPAELIIRKNLDASSTGADWYVYAPASPYFGYLQTTDAFASDNNAAYSYNQTVPTGSIFNVGNTYSGNINNDDYIAYCFRSVPGYSKVDSYQGGQTLNTANQVDFGFAPSFVLIKNTTDSSSQWMLFDNKRTNGYALFPNTSGIEEDYSSALLLSSQGLEFKSVNINVNKSGSTYIFMAIAS